MNETFPEKEKLGKTECRSPSVGRNGVTCIASWKYEVVRKAILSVMTTTEKESLGFNELRGLAKARVRDEVLSDLGSWGWYFTTVKLNMEVQGELKRLQGVSPQQLILAG